MQYSPKLKKAMKEIQAILEKNDIAGFILIHTPGFSEYLNHLKTSYSCVEMRPQGVYIRLKQSEVGAARAKEIADGTYNLVTHFSDIMSIYEKAYRASKVILKQQWNGYDGDDEHSSHEQQNN